MKIGLVQFAPKWEEAAGSVAVLNKMIDSSYSKFDLLIFPEMSLTGFTMNSARFAEEIDGIATTYFIGIARKLSTNILCGIIEKSHDSYFNSLVHINEKGLLTARYRKIHPFSYAREDKSYSAGDEPVITKIKDVKFGLSICYDLRFPELYRIYAARGAEVMVNIANWPVPRIEHWNTLLKARSIENQCYMIGVNRVGGDPANQYNGYSGVYDPMGAEVISVPDKEEIIETVIDLSKVKLTRDHLPFLQDMKLIK